MDDTPESSKNTREEWESTHSPGESSYETGEYPDECGDCSLEQLQSLPDDLQSSEIDFRRMLGDLQCSPDSLRSTREQLDSTHAHGDWTHDKRGSTDNNGDCSPLPGDWTRDERGSTPGSGGSREKRGKLLSDEKDAELLRLLRSDDAGRFSKALRELMREHREPVLRWFTKKFGDIVPRAELDDMKQEFYCWLWETRARTIRKSITGCLIQKIWYDCISYLRFKGTANKNDPEHYQRLPHFTTYIQGDPYYCTQLDDQWAEIQEECCRAHEVGLIINAMGKRNRAALLHQLDGKSISESAVAIGISDNTVRIYRARAKEKLEKSGLL